MSAEVIAMTSSGAHEQPAFELLNALENVISRAHDDLASEARMDLAQEVAETVRHEHLNVYWRDRVGDTRQELILHIRHEAVPKISGSVSWIAQDYLELYATSGIYLISIDAVWAISGLTKSATIANPTGLEAAFANAWLHDLCDQHIEATWFIDDGNVIVGKCLRVGPDAIDIQHQGHVLSLLRKHLRTVRI